MMKRKIFLLLGIICITLFVGCESDWYPIYEDWLCTINVDGTDLEYIRNSYGNFLLSPDRQTLIEYTKNKFYSVDLNDLSSRTLLLDFGDNTDEIYNPSMSNTHVAFTHNADIYSLNIETKDTIRLTFDGTFDMNPSFSSDGTKIVYTTTSDSLSTIVIMNSDGSNKEVIIEQSENKYNKHFLFVMDDHVLIYYIKWKSGIYSINIDGSDNHCMLEDVSPLYLTRSPSRDYIIFTVNGYLQRINVDGTENIILAETSSRGFNSSISPNDAKILYAKDDYPHIINTDGTDSYQLTDISIDNVNNPYYSMSYFLDDNKILITLRNQIN